MNILLWPSPPQFRFSPECPLLDLRWHRLCHRSAKINLHQIIRNEINKKASFRWNLFFIRLFGRRILFAELKRRIRPQLPKGLAAVQSIRMTLLLWCVGDGWYWAINLEEISTIRKTLREKRRFKVPFRGAIIRKLKTNLKETKSVIKPRHNWQEVFQCFHWLHLRTNSRQLAV